MSRGLYKYVRASLTAVVVGVVVVAMTASQALAAPSTATAQAIGSNISLVNDLLGTCTQPGSTAGCTGNGSGTNTNSALSAAVLVQTASAVPGSTLASCAGVSGTGAGMIQVGPSATCSANGTGTGVNILGGLITADAIFASCDTPVGGTPTNTTPPPIDLNIGNGNLASGGPLSGLLGGLGNLLNLGTGTLTTSGSLLNGGTLTIALGTLDIATVQTDITATDADGTLHVTALYVNLLGSFLNTLSGSTNILTSILNGLGLNGILAGLGLTGLNLSSVLTGGITLTVGTVSCGTNPAVTSSTSSLPGKAVPVAGGLVVLFGGAAFIARRRFVAIR